MGVLSSAITIRAIQPIDLEIVLFFGVVGGGGGIFSMFPLFTRREGHDTNASVDISTRVAMMKIPAAFRFGIMYSDKCTRTRDTQAGRTRYANSSEWMVVLG